MVRDILLGTGLVLSLGFSAYQVLVNRTLESSIREGFNQSHQEMLNFNQELGRANSRLDTTGALIDALSKDIPEEIRGDIDARKASVVSISSARLSNVSEGRILSTVKRVDESTSPGRGNGILSGSSDTGPEVVHETNIPKRCSEEHVNGLKDWRLDGTFTARCGEPGQFHYRLTQKFDMVQVESSDGAHYLQVYELGADGKRFGEPLVTESYNVVARPAETEQFYWWAPHLNIGVGGEFRAQTFPSSPDPFVDLTISVGGYGRTHNDLDWQFIRGGIAYSNEGPSLVGCPVSYNVGGPLPLLNNVFVTPCIQWGGSASFSLDIGAQL